MDEEKKKDIIERVEAFLDNDYTKIEIKVRKEGFSIIPTKYSENKPKLQ